MAELQKSSILSNISADLADNNAGLISAADVRNNIYNVADSINAIVASGDTDGAYAFYNNVRAKITGSTGGRFVAESGIRFPNSSSPNTLQTEPFPGVASIDHNSLSNLTVADPHTQYLPIAGTRNMTGNLQMGTNWIGPSGNNGEGFKFNKTSAGIDILTSGNIIFGDNSKISSAKGIAKAWIHFDASGVGNVPVVKASYNISTLDYIDVGKFRITFASGVLGNNNYVALGSSNAISTSGSLEDFDVNTVGLVSRLGTDPSRTLTFAVKSDDNQFVNAEINELVIFADGVGVSSEASSVNIT
jgi:hypothetical protein